MPDEIPLFDHEFDSPLPSLAGQVVDFDTEDAPFVRISLTHAEYDESGNIKDGVVITYESGNGVPTTLEDIAVMVVIAYESLVLEGVIDPDESAVQKSNGFTEMEH